ncbi:MAG: hypothetical protein IIB60_03550 [Planctomycetes bacterium]|nr:hypothetical protein [Planctomycetota bacterium]
MVARFVGAGLGLLAFTITVIAGLIVQNPVDVTLSRSILALFLFCMIGLALGTVAEMVVAEHERKRESEIRREHREEEPSSIDKGLEGDSSGQEAVPADAS